jgi:hypothetical protein
MSQDQLNQAREYIKAKRYSDARALLVTLNSPIAQKWLAEIDRLASSPASVKTTSQKSTNALDYTLITSIIQSVILLLILFITVYTAFSRTDAPEAVPWEYATMQYSQYDWFGSIYESVFVSRESYMTAFNDVLLAGCSEETSAIDEVCISNFQGLDFFINTMGADGWEVITVINQSSQDTYRLEVYLKRKL